jgi:peptidoglycan/xylan/chitin deacetylase (PgdA/CDA1 family)
MRSGVFGRARTSGPPSRPEVALTYDDGPDSLATAALLDLLRTRGVPAAFFVVGRNARAHPDLVRRARDEGHLLANHSDRHAWWTNFLSGSRLLREMEACATALEETTGERPRHYRPPVGLMNPSVAPAAAALGLTLVGWSVRSLDRTRRTAEQVASRVLRRVRAGDIILLHDGGQAPDRIVRITERILDGLSARGLRAVRLDRLWR